MASGFEARGTGSFHAHNLAEGIGHPLGYTWIFWIYFCEK
jgi:hypothetical protein